MQSLIDLDLPHLVLAYSLVLLAVGLSMLQRIGQGREILWASLRMVAQLLAVGYVLHAVFAVNQPIYVLAILLLMVVVAVQTVVGRVQVRMPRLRRVVGTAIFCGCLGTTFFFTQLVIGLAPWYDPHYLIPLAGMIIGNSMTGASLAAERLGSDVRARREEIETALCLGASSRQAILPMLRQAYQAALTPSINAMAAMGIVFLPGMMTGQILSGTAPFLAVKYQIAIMCVITGSVALTSFLILHLGWRQFFTPAHQLRPWVAVKKSNSAAPSV